MPTPALTFFKFEADFVESLRCIPMQVRYKLDTCGVKLKLEHWHKFNQGDRESLVSHPCATPTEIDHYRDLVQATVLQYTETPAKDLPIDPHPPWLQTTVVPADVVAQAAKFETAIGTDAWSALQPLERFALCKLSRSGHENRNFVSALQEFGLQASASETGGKSTSW
ncbi:nitrate reductase associated protein [Halomicronema sp. CCY15110]|uniref:nitrate reductase associated protein n=1 Tax=Halomicronema sp. CCY15110 TaxID=2767773 RepID=UPI00194F657F|nr:nitrate reductase associated protein [Halomicronema sp. CCY15110]